MLLDKFSHLLEEEVEWMHEIQVLAFRCLAYGLQPNSNASNLLAATSDGLQPKDDGLQPTCIFFCIDVLVFRIIKAFQEEEEDDAALAKLKSFLPEAPERKEMCSVLAMAYSLISFIRLPKTDAFFEARNERQNRASENTNL